MLAATSSSSARSSTLRAIRPWTRDCDRSPPPACATRPMLDVPTMPQKLALRASHPCRSRGRASRAGRERHRRAARALRLRRIPGIESAPKTLLKVLAQPDSGCSIWRKSPPLFRDARPGCRNDRGCFPVDRRTLRGEHARHRGQVLDRHRSPGAGRSPAGFFIRAGMAAGLIEAQRRQGIDLAVDFGVRFPASSRSSGHLACVQFGMTAHAVSFWS